MSKFLRLLFVSVVFLVGWRLTSSFAQQTLFSTQNGDINGDGLIDLTDATRLLAFVLYGEEPPVPLDPNGHPDESNPSPASEEVLALIREHAETALASFPGLEEIEAESDSELGRLMLTNRELLLSGQDADGWTLEHAKAYIIAFQAQDLLGRALMKIREDLITSQLECIKGCQDEVEPCLELCAVDPGLCNLSLCNHIMTDCLFVRCGRERNCSNGIDDDGDGAVDCEDLNCAVKCRNG